MQTIPVRLSVWIIRTGLNPIEAIIQHPRNLREIDTKLSKNSHIDILQNEKDVYDRLFML